MSVIDIETLTYLIIPVEIFKKTENFYVLSEDKLIVTDEFQLVQHVGLFFFCWGEGGLSRWKNQRLSCQMFSQE